MSFLDFFASLGDSSDDYQEERTDRFPNVDWYCDRCGAQLNYQDGFDDHHYVWRCTECGHKNSISSDNIYESEDDYRNNY